MSGEIELIEKSYIDALGKVKQCQKIIDRGIRSPLEIVESFDGETLQENPPKRAKRTINL